MNRIDRMTVYRYVTYNDIFSKPEGFSTESSDKSVEEYEIEIPNNQRIRKRMGNNLFPNKGEMLWHL